MPEEKLLKINLWKQMKNVPKWKRNAVFGRLLRKRLKSEKMKIGQSLNEKFWSGKSPKVRLKVVKDDKSVRADAE